MWQSQVIEYNRLIGLHMGGLRALLDSPEHTEVQKEVAGLRTSLHTAPPVFAEAPGYLQRVLAFLRRVPLPSV